ncbi:hypothetical protein ACJJTC_014962 [Scirpophaga incertulas]
MDPRLVVLLYWYRRHQRSRRRQNRRFWVHPINQESVRTITFEKLFENRRNDEKMFFNYFRMSIESFEKLLTRLENSSLPKSNTNMRKCLSTKMKLAICLRYLASGCSMKDLLFIQSWSIDYKWYHLGCLLDSVACPSGRISSNAFYRK